MNCWLHACTYLLPASLPHQVLYRLGHQHGGKSSVSTQSRQVNCLLHACTSFLPSFLLDPPCLPSSLPRPVLYCLEHQHGAKSAGELLAPRLPSYLPSPLPPSPSAVLSGASTRRKVGSKQVNYWLHACTSFLPSFPHALPPRPVLSAACAVFSAVPVCGRSQGMEGEQRKERAACLKIKEPLLDLIF